jgi:hypothetical protein
MRNAILFLTMLSVGIGMSGQQTSSINPATSKGCPIGFGAQVNGRAIAQTADDQKKNGNGPLLEMMFSVRDTAKILSAGVTVHGLSSSNRYLPVDQHSDENAAQTFKLDRASGADGLTNAAVWLNKILFVNWAEVIELKFADGSVWHESSDSRCRTVPSKLLLVDATAVGKAQK